MLLSYEMHLASAHSTLLLLLSTLVFLVPKNMANTSTRLVISPLTPYRTYP
jgi:hypothetical protein